MVFVAGLSVVHSSLAPCIVLRVSSAGSYRSVSWCVASRWLVNPDRVSCVRRYGSLSAWSLRLTHWVVPASSLVCPLFSSGLGVYPVVAPSCASLLRCCLLCLPDSPVVYSPCCVLVSCFVPPVPRIGDAVSFVIPSLLSCSLRLSYLDSLLAFVLSYSLCSAGRSDFILVFSSLFHSLSRVFSFSPSWTLGYAFVASRC